MHLLNWVTGACAKTPRLLVDQPQRAQPPRPPRASSRFVLPPLVLLLLTERQLAASESPDIPHYTMQRNKNPDGCLLLSPLPSPPTAAFAILIARGGHDGSRPFHSDSLRLHECLVFACAWISAKWGGSLVESFSAGFPPKADSPFTTGRAHTGRNVETPTHLCVLFPCLF